LPGVTGRAIPTPWRSNTALPDAIASVTTDGADDGEPTYAAAAARQPDVSPKVAARPRASAVPRTTDPAGQRATGYGRRIPRRHRCRPMQAPDRTSSCGPAACPASGARSPTRSGARPHDPCSQARLRSCRMIVLTGGATARRVRLAAPMPFATEPSEALVAYRFSKPSASRRKAATARSATPLESSDAAIQRAASRAAPLNSLAAASASTGAIRPASINL
jgi:hypothetical protein